MVASYIDQLPEIAIKDGVVRVSYKGDCIERVIPIRIARLIISHAQRVLDEYDAAGNVIMVPKLRLGKQS